MGWKSRASYATKANICPQCGSVHYEESRKCKTCREEEKDSKEA